MQELKALLNIEELPLSSRSDFNKEAENLSEFLHTTLDPIYCLVLSDRLSELAKKIKDTVAFDVETLVSLWEENTAEMYGDVITKRVTKIWEYPADAQVEKYECTIAELESRIQPTLEEIAGIKASLKKRLEALENEGSAILKDEKITISIKKK